MYDIMTLKILWHSFFSILYEYAKWLGIQVSS